MLEQVLDVLFLVGGGYVVEGEVCGEGAFSSECNLRLGGQAEQSLDVKVLEFVEIVFCSEEEPKVSAAFRRVRDFFRVK